MTPTHPTPEELPALISFLIRTTRWHSLHLKLVADPEIGRADTGLWLNSLFSAAGEALREEGSSPWETLQQLEIEARDVRLQEFIRLPFATIAPNLRELMISLRQIPNAYQLVDGFVNPKKLCRLEIDAHINWKDDILPTFYYQTLAQATNLECVKVLDHYCGSELFDFDFSATVSSFPVSNCTLTTLALHDNRATRDCLQNLSLPSLTSLTFISSTSGLDFDFSLSLSVVVGRLIDRSDCKIKHVRLENTPKLRSLCVQLIRLLTTVEILELHLPSSPSWHSPLLLKRMSAQALDDTDPILPNLTSFSVSLSSPITGEIKEAFTDFVEHPSRWPASEEGGAVNLPGAVQCARLENAHLFYCGSMSTSMEYARGRRSG
ncbi:hypothetical protein EST38_g2253 [Candolleomyces aberdarensis]|uniref:F-box protein n=1 Tax=Candolleomyces aberdarensis TaxID=2316362 RepID=A0A4Q2DV47_9AGAR|nr:hypothetical protein EST38_g2253 [Candolleomyces aberdarensis]